MKKFKQALSEKFFLNYAQFETETCAARCYLSTRDEARSDGRVDVAAGDVAEGLSQGGHCDSEAEGNLHHIHSATAAATAHQHLQTDRGQHISVSLRHRKRDT